jgi:hypothetical protein
VRVLVDGDISLGIGAWTTPGENMVGTAFRNLGDITITASEVERVKGLERVANAAFNHIHGDCGDCRELNDALAACSYIVGEGSASLAALAAGKGEKDG